MSEEKEQAAGVPVAKINPVKMEVPLNDTPDGAQAASTEKGASAGKPTASAGLGAAPPSNVAGLWSFIKSIFVRQDSEQRPDRTVKENLDKAREDSAKASGGHKGLGEHKKSAMLFSAVDAPLHGLTPDDLHYANEVDAALARRPRFGVRLLSLTVALLFVCLIVWAAIANVDEVTHSDGQVIGSQRTQTIQNLEGGILRGIMVREGQIVEKGSVLAQLDNELAESSYRDAVNKAIENQLALIRLEAEFRNEKPVFPEDLRGYLTRRFGHDIDTKTLTRAKQTLKDQEYAWESRKALLDSDLQVLQAQCEQRTHDVKEQEARKEQLQKSLSLAEEQLKTASELMQRKNFARMEYLNLQQKVVELRGQIDMLNASIPKALASANEATQRVASREAEQRAQITQEITKRRVELTSLRETMSSGGDRVTRTELRAPVRGTVKQIHINTVGGVVKPGEAIMDLVPLDDTLLIEARVMPKDVAFLRPGQDVMVKVSAYDFSIYGGLEGKLESISADTIEDKRGDFHYLVKVRTPKTAIVHNNDVLPIMPGMMVTADILIGKKSVLDYLLKPILKAKQNALRER